MNKSIENKWTRSNREAVVVGSHVGVWTHDEIGYPTLEHLSSLPADNRIRKAVENSEPIWCLTTKTRTGLDGVSSHFSFFPTKEEAEKAIEPIGSASDPEAFLAPVSKTFQVGSLSRATSLAVEGLRGDDPPFMTIYDALHGAGVFEHFRLGRLVLDWIGDEGREWLNSEYGENWECVALLEYCLAHFPSSSLASISARIMVAHFIAHNDYDAGFASRELLMLATGAEEEAQAALKRKTKAAKEGGRKSAIKRTERLEAFILELEAMAPMFPQISEERILDQAWENLCNKRADWPKTGIIRTEYEAELRSDDLFKHRYGAVFSKNA